MLVSKCGVYLHGRIMRSSLCPTNVHEKNQQDDVRALTGNATTAAAAAAAARWSSSAHVGGARSFDKPSRQSPILAAGRRRSAAGRCCRRAPSPDRPAKTATAGGGWTRLDWTSVGNLRRERSQDFTVAAVHGVGRVSVVSGPNPNQTVNLRIQCNP